MIREMEAHGYDERGEKPKKQESQLRLALFHDLGDVELDFGLILERLVVPILSAMAKAGFALLSRGARRK
jgi:hypothetical protein